MTAATTLHPDDVTRLAAGAACLDAALEYMRIGWAVVPVCDPHHVGEGKEHGKACKSPGKAVRAKWSEVYRGQRAPYGDAELRGFWRGHPTRNVGLLCGVISGVVAIDVDGDRGAAALAAASGGDLPETVEFRTPSGGRRYIYAVPHGTLLRTTHQGLLDAAHQGVSYLGDGGHTVLPPSRGANGKRYEWLPGKSILQRPPAPAPKWLLDKLRVEPHGHANGQAAAGNGDPGEYPAYDARLLFACAFMRHWRDDAPTLPEPEWLAGIRTAAHAVNGREVVHECSRNYAGYTPEETDRKIAESLEQKPRTCASIDAETGGVWCRACPVRGEIHSPVALAVIERPPEASSDQSATERVGAGKPGDTDLTAFQDRRREKARKRVSKSLGVGELVRVVQFGRENASFELTFHPPRGPDFSVALASMEQLSQQSKVQARIAEKVGRYPRGVERGKWLRVVNDILRLREIRDTGSVQETVADWILAYISENDHLHCAFGEPGITVEEALGWKKAKSFRDKDGTCYISLNAFQEWMSFKRLAIAQKDLTKALSKLGFRKRKVIRRKLERRFWVSKSWFKRGEV